MLRSISLISHTLCCSSMYPQTLCLVLLCLNIYPSSMQALTDEFPGSPPLQFYWRFSFNKLPTTVLLSVLQHAYNLWRHSLGGPQEWENIHKFVCLLQIIPSFLMKHRNPVPGWDSFKMLQLFVGQLPHYQITLPQRDTTNLLICNNSLSDRI